MQFPTSKDFDAKTADATASETNKWLELPTGIYAITKLKGVKGRFGESFIGDLEAETGEKFQAWLPTRLSCELKGKKLPVFVRHEGLKQSQQNSSRHYHAYTLL
jgi:hypothetical protein